METEKKKLLFRVSAEDFKKIPGNPIAYWISSQMLLCFDGKKPLDNSYAFREGIHTADNDRFLRLWFEIPFLQIVFDANNYNDIDRNGKYVPYNKGGAFRKWYGNNEYVIGFDREHRDEMASMKGQLALADMPEKIHEVFKMSGFDKILKIYPTFAEAKASFS